MFAKRSTIVLLAVGLSVAWLLIVGPRFKRWRIDRAVAELQSPEAQKPGEVPRTTTRLLNIGLQDDAVVSAVLLALNDDEARQRYWGQRPEAVATSVPRLFDLLPGIGAPAVPTLIELLHHEDRLVRGIAADTLERLGAAAEPAIPVLMAAANDPMARENRYKDVNKPLDALIKLGRPAVPALVESLKNEEPDIRQQAVEALYLMRAEAEAAAPALVNLLVGLPDAVETFGSPDITPGDVLVRIGTPAMPHLQRGLNQQHEEGRRRLEAVLRKIEQAPKSMDDRRTRLPVH